MLGVGAIGAAVVFSLRGKARASGSPRERPVVPPRYVPPRSEPQQASSPPSAVPMPVVTPRGSIYGSGGSIDPEYPPEVWIPVVNALVATEYPRIDPRIAMQWLVMESDGAPCAFGVRTQLGPDGQPRELGLGQIFNPDDFKTLGLAARGITPSSFRAYCAPNTQHRTRALTAQEMDDQVRYTLLALIDRCMQTADRTIAKHDLKWSGVDYWKIVKAQHALPVILSQGLPAVVKKLGRAPASWAEFRQALGMENNARWRKSLDNAEKLASASAPAGSV